MKRKNKIKSTVNDLDKRVVATTQYKLPDLILVSISWVTIWNVTAE